MDRWIDQWVGRLIDEWVGGWVYLDVADSPVVLVVVQGLVDLLVLPDAEGEVL